MIRINLLGRQKAKTKRAATTAVDFESSGSPNSANVFLGIIVLAVTVGSIWWYQGQLAREAASIQNQMHAALREAQTLGQTKERYEQRQKEKEEHEARVRIIDALRSRQ